MRQYLNILTGDDSAGLKFVEHFLRHLDLLHTPLLVDDFSSVLLCSVNLLEQPVTHGAADHSEKVVTIREGSALVVRKILVHLTDLLQLGVEYFD